MPTMDSIPEHELNRLAALASADQPLEKLIERRKNGEPLQYIEGSAAFGPLQLRVDDRVLVPRPETEGLFDIASRMVRHPEVILDLCTGSGALALALKNEFPGASVFATDVSADAIDVGLAFCRQEAKNFFGVAVEECPDDVGLGQERLAVGGGQLVSILKQVRNRGKNRVGS